MLENKTVFNTSLKAVIIDIGIILLFLLISYLIIASKYNFATGDTGTYAFKTRLFYEKNEIDMKEQLALSLGQLFFGYVFSHILGFSLKTLNISAYCAVFLCMIFFYLLLLQVGIDRFWAMVGALSLFINPITLRFIDWYMTESYFLFYLIVAINLYVAGLQSHKARYFYIGALFSVIAILTRQFAISLSMALIFLLYIERKGLKHLGIPIAVAAILPVVPLVLLYHPSAGDSQQLFATRILFMKRLINPLYFLRTMGRDALYTLHYAAIYALPFVLLLIISAFINKDDFDRLLKDKPIALAVSSIFIITGTLILFFKGNRLMPYLPSIFSIGNLTSIFNIKILEEASASTLLTIFTAIGGILILALMIDDLRWDTFKKMLLGKGSSGGKTQARYFIYLIGFFYFLVNMVTRLVYDRYIFPVAIFIIFFIILKCHWIAKFKKTALIILLIIWVVFMFNLKRSRMSEELLWDGCNMLMERGVKPIEINAEMGFSVYYSCYEIYDIYRNVTINRPINWHKFHPMANYFLAFSPKRLGSNPGLEFMETLENNSLFKTFKKKLYIYKRKNGYTRPIWVR